MTLEQINNWVMLFIAEQLTQEINWDVNLLFNQIKGHVNIKLKLKTNSL